MCSLIYIISKRYGIIFIVVALLVSHIGFAFRSTSIRFGPLWSIQFSSDYFSSLQSSYDHFGPLQYILVHFRLLSPLQSNRFSVYIYIYIYIKRKKRDTKLTFCDDFRLNKLMVATIST